MYSIQLQLSVDAFSISDRNHLPIEELAMKETKMDLPLGMFTSESTGLVNVYMLCH